MGSKIPGKIQRERASASSALQRRCAMSAKHIYYALAHEFQGKLYRLDGYGPMGYDQAQCMQEQLQRQLDDRGIEITIEIGAWEETVS